MEPDKHSNASSTKKNWLFFAVGLLVGFILSFSIYFCDKYLFHEKIHFSSTIDHLYEPLMDLPDTVERVRILEQKAVPSSKTAPDTLPADSAALLQEYEDLALEESEFESEMEEEDISVLHETLVNSRKVKVFVQDTADLSAKSDYIKVEQWTSPIKNRHTYQFSHKTLKLTGMDISQIRIIYFNGNYYLANGSAYFLLKPNFDFDKLIETDVNFY